MFGLLLIINAGHITCEVDNLDIYDNVKSWKQPHHKTSGPPHLDFRGLRKEVFGHILCSTQGAP